MGCNNWHPCYFRTKHALEQHPQLFLKTGSMISYSSILCLLNMAFTITASLQSFQEYCILPHVGSRYTKSLHKGGEGGGRRSAYVIIFMHSTYVYLYVCIYMYCIHIKVSTKTSFSRINERGGFSHSILGTNE